MDDCSRPMEGEPVEQFYYLNRAEEHQEMEEAEIDTPLLPAAKSDKHRKRPSQRVKPSESWMVAIVACGFTALQAGGVAAIGVYMVELVEYFNFSKAEVSWIGALQLSLGGVGGIAIGGLVAKFGGPRTATLGALLVSGGQIAATFCNTIPALCVTLGYSVGLGISCWLISCQVAVQSCYVHRRSLAQSVMTVGICFGGIVWPVWTEYLIRVFNWRGALLINAAMTLHGIPLAMLLRIGLNGKGLRKTDTPEQQDNVKSNTNGISVSAIESQDEAVKLKQTLNLSKNSTLCPDDEYGDDILLPSLEQENKVITTKDIIHKSSARSIYIELFHMPEVILFIISAGCINNGHVMTMAFLPTRAVSLGISKELAATLVSVIGVLGAVGRLGSGYLGDFFSKRRLVMYSLSATLTGTASILSAFACDYAALVVYSIVFALFSGCYVSFLSTVMTDLAGVKRLPQVLSLHMSFMGSFVIFNVTTSGMLVDHTRNTAVAFIYCGSIQILGALISAIASCIQKKRIDRANHILDKM